MNTRYSHGDLCKAASAFQCPDYVCGGSGRRWNAPEKDDFDALVKSSEELTNARTAVRARATEDIIKYDYDRMVYASLA